MTLAVLSQEAIVSKENYRERMSEICATQIVEWLHLGNQQCAGFLHEKNGFRAVQPSDMAILVNRRIEATSIRKALSRRGVRSFYLSDRDSIYATRQAHEVQRWLSACAEPDNDKLLRAALSTPSLGLPFRELDELNSNEEAWEARVVQFKGYREIWQKQGVLPTIRRILFDFGCTDRLLTLASDPAGQSGERILTDLLHLAEVLQQASVMLEGEHALIRHLSEQMAEAEDENKEAADEKKMRLESDADLVKVVTIHKSKGLEYPIVFLPFICDTRLTKNSDVPLKWHDDGGELQVSLVSDAEILESAERDRLGEDLRKVYVALTRARYMTWLGIARVNESEPCAISHLFGLKDVEVPRYLETIQTFAKDQSSIFVTNDLKSDLSKFCGADRQNAPGAAFRAKRAVKENWWISSYSALHFEGHSAPELPALDDTPQAENLIEAQREILSVAPTDRGGSQSMHGFPKGASAGVFLHELMESAANLGFAEVMADPEKLPEKFKDMITRGCELRRWEDWIDTICTWVKQMLSTELKIGEKPVQLSSLKTVKAEMEFWFETTQVDLLDLDGTVKANTLEERDRPSLTPGTLNGMLKGFMDLVFEHEGRYYVADYKSNWLGPTDEAYTREAMDEAIRAHRYDLQYVIYLLALHRLLKSRLRGYDYDRHVGGAVYLFVRGINATSRGVHFEKPPKQLIERLDACFAGAAGGVQ
jgi:exodeoxyribonuclease V beta subunit